MYLLKNMDLHEEAERATTLLAGKIVEKVERHRPKEVLIRFTDGTSLFVDHQPDDLDLSITLGVGEKTDS